jgi:hypothetical protein
MRRRHSELGAHLLLLGVATPLASQDQSAPEGGGATFLLLPVGARAAALGQAAMADAGSNEAAFWNPAGLASLPGSEVTVHYAKTFASDNTVLAGYLDAKRLGVVGVAAYLVDFGSQEVQPGPGLPTGRISVKNLEFLASYATELIAGLALGLNYKLIQFRQDCSGECGNVRTAVGTTHGIDVGLQYAFGSTDAFRLGLAVRHAGFKLQLENKEQADPLPTRVAFGAAYRVSLPRSADATEGLDARILLDIEDSWGQYDDPEFRLGLELGYGNVVHLRTGYAFLDSESAGPSIGVGFEFGRFAFDFARIFYASSSFDEPVHIALRVVF